MRNTFVAISFYYVFFNQILKEKKIFEFTLNKNICRALFTDSFLGISLLLKRKLNNVKNLK